MTERKRIWLILEGKRISPGKLEVLRFVSILSSFQRFVYDYGKARGVRREYLTLFLEKVDEGSVRVQMLPKQTLHPIPLQAVDFIERLTASLDDIKDAKNLVTSEFRQDGNLIIQTLKKLEDFWSQDTISVKIGVGVERPEKIIPLAPDKKEKLIQLRREFEKQYAQVVQGVILESKFYGDKRRFEVITPTGEKIKCYYDPHKTPELEDIVYEHIKRTVEVVGFLEEKGRAKSMSVIEIKSWDKLELKGEFAGYRLKKPIALNIEYDNFNNLWCVENKDLELYGCGESLEEALEVAKVNFEVLIEEYLTESDDVLSEKALELKKRLAEYVEVTKLG